MICTKAKFETAAWKQTEAPRCRWHSLGNDFARKLGLVRRCNQKSEGDENSEKKKASMMKSVSGQYFARGVARLEAKEWVERGGSNRGKWGRAPCRWMKSRKQKRNTSALSLINAAFLPFRFLARPIFQLDAGDVGTPRCVSVSPASTCSLSTSVLLSFICRAECGRAAKRAPWSAHLVPGSVPRSPNLQFAWFLFNSARYNPLQRRHAAFPAPLLAVLRIAFCPRVFTNAETQPMESRRENTITPYNFE